MPDGGVANWLADLGLERYAPAFEQAQIDFDTLAELTVADLREIGVTAVGPRRRLENAIARLRAERVPAEPSSAAVEARRHLSILFCDVVGSTALSRRCDAEQLSTMFREYYEVVTQVVSRRGGHEANRLGDGSLIFFGYPHAREHAALQAVLTAREILEETARLVRDPEGNPIRVRAGIASGMVVLNRADTKNVFGDTPNIAARVQSLAGSGEVVVADSTRRLLRDLVRLESRGEHALKGIAEPMPVWRVLDDAEPAQPPTAPGITPTFLVGRDRELARLHVLWDEVRSGHGRSVYLTAEAGLGKSHLSRVFAERVLAAGARQKRFRCSSESVDSPFYPFVREAFGSEDAAELVDPDLAAALREPERDESLNLIRDRRESLIAGFARRALAGGADTPLLLRVEDAHWSDPSSLEVLSRIVAGFEHRPVMLLITTRDPEPAPEVPADAVLSLAPLDAPDVRRVVAATIGSAGVAATEDLIGEIAARADGVPFFAEELALSFAQASAARPDAVGSLADVPASLQEALQYRIDGLEFGVEVLKLAAVFGRELPMDVLRELVPSDRTLHAAVSELGAAGLLTVAAADDASRSEVLRFRHQLVLEHAYDTIMRAERVRLHARVARVLAGRADAEPAVRAHHEERAGQPTTAAHCWAIAARRAASRSADAEAATYFRRALALVPEFPDPEAAAAFEVEVLLAFLPTLMRSDGYVSAATASVNRVVELTAARAQPEQAFGALFLRWLDQLGRGSIDVAHNLGLELRGLAEQIGTEIAALLIDRMTGSTHMFRGELEAASAALERFARLHAPERHAAALAGYGATDNFTTVQCCRICVAVLRDDIETARRLQDATAAEAEALGRFHNLCHVLAYGGALGSAMEQDWEGMMRYVTRLDAVSTAHELPFWRATVNFFRGIDAARSGEPARGRALFDIGAEWFTANGAGFLLPTFGVLLCSAAGIGSNDPAELRRLDAGLDGGERWVRAELLRLQAGEALRRGGSEEAARLLRDSVELARAQGARLLVARALNDASAARDALPPAVRTAGPPAPLR